MNHAVIIAKRVLIQLKGDRRFLTLYFIAPILIIYFLKLLIDTLPHFVPGSQYGNANLCIYRPLSELYFVRHTSGPGTHKGHTGKDADRRVFKNLNHRWLYTWLFWVGNHPVVDCFNRICLAF